MNKEFIPYEQALELEELGFDESCLATIDQTGFIHIKGTEYPIRGDMWYNTIDAPIYQQAFRWFRDKYDIHYSIDRECSQHDFKWGYNWSLYNWTGMFDEYLTSAPNAPVGEWVYDTYEEAELACIVKLIEIVKNK